MIEHFKYPLVYLEWVDAASPVEYAWITPKELDEVIAQNNSVCRQFGFIYSEDENFITLFSAYIDGSPDLLSNIDMIPKKMIQRRILINNINDVSKD